MKLLFNIMSAASFGISLILVGVIIYLNMTKQQRICLLYTSDAINSALDDFMEAHWIKDEVNI